MTVLLGYIPNELGDRALDHAVEEVRLREDHLVLLNVARGDAPLESRRLYDQQRHALDERLTASGVPFEVRAVVQPEEPWEALVGAAHDVGADLVVIGLRHRSPVGKLLLGSTAQHVLLRAPCDVLCVKSPES